MSRLLLLLSNIAIRGLVTMLGKSSLGVAVRSSPLVYSIQLLGTTSVSTIDPLKVLDYVIVVGLFL